MSSSTTNIGLTKLAGGENMSNSTLNSNWDKIDTFAGNANCAVITNQYSNVLDAINAFRSSKTFPFTIQKNGNSAYNDLPSGVTSTVEWNVVCYGNKDRITAVFTIYTGGSSKNGWSWTANIYQGSIVRGWFSANEEKADKVNTSLSANTTFELSIEDNHSYLITHMTSSDESSRVIMIMRRGTYVRKFELAVGSWQSYYTETLADNKWTFANGSYQTRINIIDF